MLKYEGEGPPFNVHWAIGRACKRAQFSEQKFADIRRRVIVSREDPYAVLVEVQQLLKGASSC